MSVLIDSNILLDIFTEDKQWYDWSSSKVMLYAETETLVINPVIYAEISIGFQKIEDIEAAIPTEFIRREDIPYEAAFLAGKCFKKYKAAGGQKSSPLPDFFIGAHAAIMQWSLITRDKGRFTTYFPKLNIISPA